MLSIPAIASPFWDVYARGILKKQQAKMQACVRFQTGMKKHAKTIRDQISIIGRLALPPHMRQNDNKIWLQIDANGHLQSMIQPDTEHQHYYKKINKNRR